MVPRPDVPVLAALGDDHRLPDPLRDLLDDAARSEGFAAEPAAALAWAGEVGRRLDPSAPRRDVWSFLAATAAVDAGAARILEPHLDALGIIDEARASGIELTTRTGDEAWGVFAAEGNGMRLMAARGGGGWRLSGAKPWCSLASLLTHALVTAWIDEDRRGLFAVDLRAAGVSARSGPWHSRGLSQIVSAPVDFDAVPAEPVGDPGWYLTRPGFARGGIGVAACWWGSALPLVAALSAAAAGPRADQLAAVHLGRADVALWAARTALAEAALVVDRPHPADERLLAARVRAVVAGAAETVLVEADHALGPLPLVADAAHSRRVADLRIYLRQHHADRDLARIGRDVASTAEPPEDRRVS